MSKHTPGVWRLAPESENLVEAVIDDSTTLIASVCDIDDFSCLDPETDEEEAELVAEFAANALLIAASPDLLAACQAALAHDRRFPGPAEVTRRLVDAITKATGEAP